MMLNWKKSLGRDERGEGAKILYIYNIYVKLLKVGYGGGG